MRLEQRPTCQLSSGRRVGYIELAELVEEMGALSAFNRMRLDAAPTLYRLLRASVRVGLDEMEAGLAEATSRRFLTWQGLGQALAFTDSERALQVVKILRDIAWFYQEPLDR